MDENWKNHIEDSEVVRELFLRIIYHYRHLHFGSKDVTGRLRLHFLTPACLLALMLLSPWWTPCICFPHWMEK